MEAVKSGVMAMGGTSPTILTRIDCRHEDIASFRSQSTTHWKKTELSGPWLMRIGGDCGARILTANNCGNVSVQRVPTNRRMAVRIERKRGIVRAVGASTLVAKEMERLAAKEALLFSIKDAGGLKGLLDPSANDKTKIEVNEKVLILERLNPTPRPSTSPMLEGLWQFEWAGARSPGIVAVRTVLRRCPPELVSVESLTLEVLNGGAKANGALKFLRSIKSSFTLLMKLTVEGPRKVKEEYVEGLFSAPTVPKETIPSQLKGLVDQLTEAIEKLPAPVKDAVSSGLKFPLTGTFSRELLISYLDEEVLVARDKSGVPDVLTRLEAPATNFDSPSVIVPEYVS